MIKGVDERINGKRFEFLTFYFAYKKKKKQNGNKQEMINKIRTATI